MRQIIFQVLFRDISHVKDDRVLLTNFPDPVKEVNSDDIVMIAVN